MRRKSVDDISILNAWCISTNDRAVLPKWPFKQPEPKLRIPLALRRNTSSGCAAATSLLGMRSLMVGGLRARKETLWSTPLQVFRSPMLPVAALQTWRLRLGQLNVPLMVGEGYCQRGGGQFLGRGHH